MAQIVLTGVHKKYPSGFHAVKGVDLLIADGEFLVLLGPSGCGKSTTLRMIAGLEDTTEGSIAIGDRVVNDVHPKDRDIAMVFQNYALYPHMSVRENMAFALKLRKLPKAEIKQRVDQAAGMLGLELLLDRKPAALSGGQRQRVALGRAIVREPKAFLFDEPLSNLDAKLRTSTRGEIKALHQRLKTTTVYVTHDQEEAMTLGDRIAVLANGVVQQNAPPLEVYQHPVNRFVAGFIGTPAMNFLDGRIVADGPNLAFVEGAQGEGLHVPLEGPIAQVARARAGAEIVLGVRPQGLRIGDAGNAGAASLPVELVEPLGEQMDVTLRSPAGVKLVARVPAATLAAGTKAPVSIDPSRVHLFEPGEFGAALTTR